MKVLNRSQAAFQLDAIHLGSAKWLKHLLFVTALVLIQFFYF